MRMQWIHRTRIINCGPFDNVQADWIFFRARSRNRGMANKGRARSRIAGPSGLGTPPTFSYLIWAVLKVVCVPMHHVYFHWDFIGSRWKRVFITQLVPRQRRTIRMAEVFRKILIQNRTVKFDPVSLRIFYNI